MKRTIVSSIALICLLAGMTSAFAEKREAVDICHYSEYGGYWELISPNGNSINMHLANHDDAAPGGYTTHTGTPLDENCNVILPSCGNCLDTGHGAGCEEANCEAAVGAIDPFCLEFSWDSICVDEANEFCVDVYCTDD